MNLRAQLHYFNSLFIQLHPIRKPVSKLIVKLNNSKLKKKKKKIYKLKIKNITKGLIDF